MAVIAFEDVTKRYRSAVGRGVLALDRLSVRIEAGECFAIVGPNGAGKSTMLGLILGYLKPSRGTVRVGGAEPRAYVRRRGIGYLPEVVELPGRLRVPEALRRLAILDGLSGEERERRVAEAIRRVELGEHGRKRIRALSKGNRQRVGIAQLLLEPRDLILMDEPASGLDPMWRVRFRELVSELRSNGRERTIVISSHDLHEIERIADRVAIIDGGRLRELVDLAAPRAPDGFFVRTSGAVRLDAFLPAAVPADGGYRVAVADPAALSRALAPFLAAGGVLEALVPETPSLERAVRAVLDPAGSAGSSAGPPAGTAASAAERREAGAGEAGG